MLKNRVISRLATAYSLEKMRRALNKLKVANELTNPLQQQQSSEESDEFSNEQKKESELADKAKRIAVKKEGVKFDKS